MAGLLCLQGGAEFGPTCREMDAQFVDEAAARDVVLVPLAAAPGTDYDTAGANGAHHFRDLGVSAVTVAPDARREPAAARDAVSQAGLVVLPGGSPSRLRSALRDTGVGDVLGRAWQNGTALMGASAGAMLLCAWTLLPDQAGTPLADGLGLVPDAVVEPHFRSVSRWWDAVATQAPTGTRLLGLPECAGVIVGPGSWRAVGAAPVHVHDGVAWQVLPPGHEMPDGRPLHPRVE